MSQLILDDKMRAKLKMDEGGVDLCDASGKVVGYAMTLEEHKRFVYDLLRSVAETPEAEARRERAREQIRRGEGITTAQLWEYLRRNGVDTEVR